MPILASEGCFWPLAASITSEAKINYAYVTTQGICNNFIEVNFCMGPMVLEPNRLFQHSTTMSLINKILSLVTYFSYIVVQGMPAFHDFRILDPRYFVIQFKALVL